MKRTFHASGNTQKPSKLLIRFSDSYSDDYDEYDTEDADPEPSPGKIETKNDLYSYSSYDSSSGPKKEKASHRSESLFEYDSDVSYKRNKNINSSSNSNNGSQNPSATTSKSEPLPPVNSNLPQNLVSKPPQAASTLRLLDRYKNTTSRFSQFFGDQTVTYTLYRKKIWKKSAKRKLFQLTDSGDVIAGAECISSKLIEISNDRGLISEMDIKSHSNGPFILRMGTEKRLEITSSNHQIKVEFSRTDEESTFPYSILISKTAEFLEEGSFGNRPAIKSVKNCKLCNETGKEIVSVRKIKKNALAIDAKKNISFVSIMAIGLFMFLHKA